MERMDRYRLIGGLLWTIIGLALAVVGTLTGHPSGIVTTTIGAATLISAAVAPTSWRAARWWTARVLAVLVGLELLASVGDRFGLLGGPGESGVSWGTWPAFVDYTGLLLPGFAGGAAEPAAVVATGAELILGGLLVAGPWWRWVGKFTAGMLFCYLLAMAATVGIGEVARYGVAIQIGAALIISARGSRPRRPSEDDDQDGIDRGNEASTGPTGVTGR